MTRARVVLVAVLATLAALLPAVSASAETASQPPGDGRAFAGRIDAGLQHTCVVLDNGSVRCWGLGNVGQLGNGAGGSTIGDDETPDQSPVVSVGAGRTATAVAAGAGHSCALLDDATVRCWGRKAHLGNGVGDIDYGYTTPASDGPTVDVGGPVAQIAAGWDQTCALRTDGRVYCWGYGGLFGALGYGGNDIVGDDEKPVAVGPIDLGPGRTATAIAAGRYHTCAIVDTGDVRCWGGSASFPDGANQVLVDKATDVAPIDLDGKRATAVAAGDSATCVLVETGELYCWGQQQAAAYSTGLGAVVPSPTLVDLDGGTATGIALGSIHACVLLDDGGVRCWGEAGDGRLGYGNLEDIGDDEPALSGGPVDLGVGRTALAVSAGAKHSCALLDNLTVRCWGDGAGGQMGNADTFDIGDDDVPGDYPGVNFAGTAAYHPLTPARILDTRGGPGHDGLVAPDASIDVQVTGQGGVPTSGVYAAVVNITITETVVQGFVTAWPTGTGRPNASNLNVTDPNQTVPNLAVVPLGDGGRISLYTQGGGHLVADVFGYFEQTPQARAGRLIGVSPARVFDTRPNHPGPGPKGFVAGGQTITVDMTGAHGVPDAGVSAVVLNLTATEATGPGFVTAWPGGQARPGTSNLNLVTAGQTVPNSVIVPVGADGTVSFFSSSGAHLLADVSGYFTDDTAVETDDGLFVPTPPTRLLDTRGGAGPTGFVGPNASIDFAVSGLVGIPPTANAVVLNLTITESGGVGFVTGWPTGQPQPLASNLNTVRPGQTIANLATLPLGDPSGRVSLFSQSGGHLIADTTGYYL